MEIYPFIKEKEMITVIYIDDIGMNGEPFKNCTAAPTRELKESKRLGFHWWTRILAVRGVQEKFR